MTLLFLGAVIGIFLVYVGVTMYLVCLFDDITWAKVFTRAFWFGGV